MKSQLSRFRPAAVPGPFEADAVAASVAAEWPLIGRAEELDYVWTILSGDQPADVVLSGAAGVGKSRLAREIAARARARGWALEWIRATEATREINFGAVSRWIGPSTSDVTSSSQRLAQLGQHLRSRARAHRVLLTVDDAHLLDTGTASLLQQFGSGSNLRVVLTVRHPSVASDAVRAVWTSSRTRRIEVQPLALDQIDELLSAALGGRIDHPSRVALWRLCVGNVLLLRELVLVGLARGEMTSIDGVWHWQPQMTVTPSVRELIGSRIATLTSTERETLEAVAIGEPLPEALVTGTRYEQNMLTLERAGLVRWVPDASGAVLRLAHPLFAEAVRELMPALAARHARQSLAAAVLSAPVPSPGSELRAVVWLLDADTIPSADLLLAAARRAGRLSAHRLQERIARAGRTAHGGYDFSLLLAQALVMQGKCDETVQLCNSPPLSEATTGQQRCEVTALHAEALAWGQGRLSEANELLAAATLGQQGEATVHCLALRGAIAMFCSDLDEAVSASEQVLAVPALPDELVIRGLICAIPSLALMGRTTAAMARADRGQTLLAAGAVVPAVWQANLVYGHIFALRFAGRYGEAVRLAGEFYESSADRTRTASALAAFAFGQALLDAGQLTKAERALREGLALLRQEDVTRVLPWCLCTLTQTLALSGHANTGHEVLDPLDSKMSVAPVFRPEMARARAWVAVASGELSTGSDLAQQAATLAMQLGQVAVAARAWHDLAVMGEPRRAATELARLVDNSESDEPGLFHDHAAALAAGDAAALDRIYERFDHSGAILSAAEAAAAAVPLYLAAGHRALAERARQRVERCVAACDGATTPALRRIPSNDPMSRRESEIATLAARGLSNADIAEALCLSVRTVEGHLQHVYTKLDLHHRSDLSALAAPTIGE